MCTQAEEKRGNDGKCFQLANVLDLLDNLNVCVCVCVSNKSRLCGEEHTASAYGYRRWMYYSLAEFTLHHRGFLSPLLPRTPFPLLCVAAYPFADGADTDLTLWVL